jgi:SOS-response transcriptional repressor LexA
MHPIQRQLLELAKHVNLARLTLREMAVRIGLPGESPQKVKHHLQQLQKKGLLSIDRDGDIARTTVEPGFAANSGMGDETLFAIPIVGTANCGPATLYADENLEGILRVSRRLVQRSNPRGLYALKADGASMNRAQVAGRSIEDGDYVIVDSNQTVPQPNDIVVAIVDGKATIKKFIVDTPNNQIVLRAESSFDYEPIHLHPEDDFNFSGKAIAVIKRASP